MARTFAERVMMPDVNPGWWVAIITSVGAVIVGLINFRGSKVTTQPDAQGAINAGFTALADRQAIEIGELRARVVQAERTSRAAENTVEELQERQELSAHVIDGLQERVALLEQQEVLASTWHVDHVENFDIPALTVIKIIAPEEASRLEPKIRPYPRWKGSDS